MPDDYSLFKAMQTFFKKKSDIHLNINLWLLSVSFTIFALIVSLNTELLQNSLFSFQLVAAIPLFFTSILARSKMSLSGKPQMWDDYGYITFLLGYTFLVNVVGTLFSYQVALSGGIIFFAINFLLAIIYSFIEVIEDYSKLRNRILKDSFFILIVLIGGVFPSLGLY